MNLSQVVKAMQTAGCSQDQIGAVVIDLTVKTQSGNARRQADFRRRQTESGVTKGVTVTPTENVTKGVAVTPNVTFSAPSPSPPKITNKTPSPLPTDFETSSLPIEGNLLPPSKTQRDEAILDQITDVWNAWAAAHGSPTVKALTDRRAIHCRRRINDLMGIEGGSTPVEAFRRLLGHCEQSFFVKGNPDTPLKFDQLMTEGFMVKMIEGNFLHRPRPNGGGNGGGQTAWRR